MDELEIETLRREPQSIKLFPIDRQEEIFEIDIAFLHYAEKGVQLEYIKKKPEKVQYASFSVQDDFVAVNPEENFKLTNTDYQIKKIAQEPEFYKYATLELKQMIFEAETVEQQRAIASILSIDPTQERYIVSNNEGVSAEITNKLADEKLSMEQIRHIFLHTKFKGAEGTVQRGTLGMCMGSMITEIDVIDDTVWHSVFRSYADSTDISSLSVEQLVELIKVDANYIMQISKYDDDNIEENIERCKKVFEKLYSENVNVIQYLSIYNDIIEKIMRAPNNLAFRRRYLIEELKILFNTQIMQSNPTKLIQKYFKHILSGKEEEIKTVPDLFKKIIFNTYGEKVVSILEARPNLDIHTINSPEIFDSRIMDNFSIEFINDLITYNFEKFSCFLEIVKNPIKLEKFKMYFEILSTIMGQNASTMQKAIIEFDYIKEIMEPEILSTIIEEDEEHNDSYDKQRKLKLENNFLTAICSGNLIEVKTIEDLEHYEERANKMLKSIRPANENIDYDKIDKKNLICLNLFGTSYSVLKDFSALFGISEELTEKIKFTSEEKVMAKVINFIINEDSFDKIEEFKRNISSLEGIRNPVTLFSAMRKIREQQTQIMSQTLLTKEQMDKAIEEEIKLNPDTPMEERPIYKIICKDGTEEYHLNGYDIAILISKIEPESRITVEEQLNLESQQGNSAICCRYINSKIKPENLMFYYSGKYFVYVSLKAEQLIAAKGRNEMAGDALTYHDRKLVNMSAKYIQEVTDIDAIASYELNEVSFYRVIREHLERNGNAEGRIMPDFYRGEFSSEEKQLLKELGIPRLVIHEKKYQNRKNTEPQSTLENKTEEGR